MLANLTPDLVVFLATVAVLWTAVVLYLAKLEPPVEPLEFGAACQCGHRFDSHATARGVDGSPCHFSDEEDRKCDCHAFEPLATLRTWEPPRDTPGDRHAVFPLPPRTLELVPLCQHPAYSVDVPGTGEPLRCVDCGEELTE